MPDDLNANPENFPKSQDDLNKIIQNALAPKLNKINALEAEKTQITQERDSLTQQVSERDQKITDLESTVGERDRTILVTEVAHAKKVPAKYLTGDSKEALEAAADEFLADVAKLNTPSTEGKASGASNQPDEVVQSSGTGDETPAKPSYKERLEEAYTKARNGQKGVTI